MRKPDQGESPVPVGGFIRKNGREEQIPGHQGGPRIPHFGETPDKATQNIPLLDLIAWLNNLGSKKK